MVRLMPSTAIDPLRIIQGAKSAGNPMRRRRNSPSSATEMEGPDAIDVALDDMAAEPPVGPQRPFQVDRPAGRQPAQGGHPQGLGRDVHDDMRPVAPDDGQADAVRRQAVAEGQLRPERGVELEHGAIRLAGDGAHRPGGFNESCEHRLQS